ncbi:hypothetical protein [Phytoactinopolyspora halophila]|uniref:hypothetical protein n=1 Tax=Phytoactinopolyspora halophila TaxID=1981511 RepID=UPI001B8CEE2F|nr:hypothetical protein [Phytoactinopolyspora halophila]
MRVRLLAGAGAVVVAAGAAMMVAGGGSSDDGLVRAKVSAQAGGVPLVVPASSRESEPVEALDADPGGSDESGEDASAGLQLHPPDEVSDWESATFTAEWSGPDGTPVHGVVDLQQVDGDEWTQVDEVQMDDDGGSVEVDVSETGIYRLGYGGSDDMEETVSDAVTVVVDDELLPSRITATATPGDDGTAEITATWTTEAGVAIVGELQLQERRDGEWDDVTTVTTDADSTATVDVEADRGARFRFVYDGGSRFEAVRSDAAVVADEEVRTIPVSTCSTSTEIDNLPNGEACHFTPVSSGTFVVAHDYLGNAWWNAMPMGTVVELEGEHAGLYEVVEREFAPGRGSALGPASNWTCGAECDVILQTCQGSNTGFTWLRELD